MGRPRARRRRRRRARRHPPGSTTPSRRSTTSSTRLAVRRRGEPLRRCARARSRRGSGRARPAVRHADPDRRRPGRRRREGRVARVARCRAVAARFLAPAWADRATGMRLSRVTFETEPPADHRVAPAADGRRRRPPTRARIVQALDRLLRGRAATLDGTLADQGVMAEFVVVSSAGPVLPGVPTIVRSHDLDASAGAAAAAPSRRVGPSRAGAGRLARRRSGAPRIGRRDGGAPSSACAGARDRDRITREGTAPDDCRREVRAYVDELDAALRATSLPDSRRVELLERGTVLVADAARLGVCRPQTVRALLEAVDSLTAIPVRSAAMAGRNGEHVVAQAVMAELDAPAAAGGTSASEALASIESRLQASERPTSPPTNGRSTQRGAVRWRCTRSSRRCGAAPIGTPAPVSPPRCGHGSAGAFPQPGSGCRPSSSTTCSPAAHPRRSARRERCCSKRPTRAGDLRHRRPRRPTIGHVVSRPTRGALSFPTDP